ncbi:PH domain-containing protein [Microbacterium arborescens]
MASEEKLIEHARKHLDPGESVSWSIRGSYEVKLLGNDTVRTGVLLATDRRVVFYAKKLGGYELESFPYKSISSFEAGKTMMGGNITFFATGNRVHVKWVTPATSAQKFAEVVHQMMHHLANSASSASGSSAMSKADVLEDLAQLGSLRDSGVLTEDEFNSKKAELLARI